MREPTIQIELNESAAHAIRDSITVTLDMFRGTENPDTTELETLKTFFTACILEFEYQRQKDQS